MTVSARIQEILMTLLGDGLPHSVQEMKRKLDDMGVREYSEGQFSGSINTLLRNKAIRKIDRAVYALNEGSGGKSFMRKCFVVSPIGDEGSEIRNNADKLLKYIITPVCQACGFDVERVDQINDTGSITQTIIEKLQTAELVIADISGHNPNVFYEMGFRKCTGKPIVHLKKKGESIPFDVNTIRTFEYDLTDLDSVDAVKERLQQTVSAFSYESVSDEEEQQVEKPASDVVPLLYQIQDSIVDLKDEVCKINKETIQTIMQTRLDNVPQAESSDAVLMKLLVPELIKNPQSFLSLMQIAETANKLKK